MDLRKTGLALALTLPLFIAGCNTTPGWVANPKAAYPEDQYLVAIGSGDTRRAAENTADANLARIFESRIQSDERLKDVTSETETEMVRESSMSTDVSVVSSQKLINVQHAEAWLDNEGRYHAVAYLNRRETALIYSDLIAKTSARVNFLIEQAGQTQDILKKYAMLRAANRYANENEVYMKQLKIIHPQSASNILLPGYFLSSIQRDLATTAKKIRVAIDVKGDDLGRITACVQELITSYGFVVGHPNILDFRAGVIITDKGERVDNLFFVNYGVIVQVKDTEGNILISLTNKGRESHLSSEGARTRAYRTMENAINSECVRRLDAYFDSLIEKSE